MKNKLALEWNESDIIEEKVQFILSCDMTPDDGEHFFDDEGNLLSEDELREIVSYDVSEEWNDLTYEMDVLFKKVFPKGEVGMIAEGHGWRGLSGHIPVEKYDNGSYAITRCFPNSGEVSFKIYLRKNSEYGYHIAINTVHHDVPMWGQEWSYVVRPKYMKGI